jgi:putative Mg2+ transporter-C (MgtC) family protein
MGSVDVLPEVALKFLLAIVLAGTLGLERERKGRAAGLRTHVLVCLGATLAMVVADLLAQELDGGGTRGWLDKGRIAAGVITGVGFLGAGTIINVGSASRGLTTAAMIWFAAALGIAIGAGYFLVATCATAFALFVAVGLKYLAHLLPSEEQFTLSVRTHGGLGNVDDIEDALIKEGCRLEASRLRVAEHGDRVEMSFQISSTLKGNAERLVSVIEEQFGDVERITFER